MNNKIISAFVNIIIIISLNIMPLKCGAVSNCQSVIDGIAALNENFSQDYTDNVLPLNTGASAEWYTIALSRYTGLDFYNYIEDRSAYLENNFPQSACERQRYSLAIMAAGYENQFVRDTAFDSIGQQGIMSYIFGLHMLNNGCEGSYTAEEVVDILLSMQLPDGGFAISGDVSDVDVTAMALQALAPHTYNQNVYDAVQRALTLLSERQLPNGGYQSYGVENPESSAQVITALSCLGIDPFNDERFIKDGTILDAIYSFRLPDGSFSHTLGGSYNAYATVQVFYSMVAAEMYYRGENYYIFGRQRTEFISQPPETSPPPQTTQPAPTAPIISENENQNQNQNVQTTPLYQNNNQIPQNTTAKAVNTSNNRVTSSTSVTSAVTQNSTSPAETHTNISETTASATTSLSSTPTTPPHSDTSNENLSQDTTSIETMLSAEPQSDNHINPKIILYVFIAAAGTVACIVFIRTGRKNIKNFVFTGIAVTAGCILVTAVNIQSPDDYYNTAESKESTYGTVTITIRCDTISDKIENTCILDDYAVQISDGDTVYDVLVEAVKANKIQLDGDSGYIRGINYLYEFDYGDLSGWIYHVNGIEAPVGCGEYEVSDGDFIEWLYTCDLGHDLK